MEFCSALGGETYGACVRGILDRVFSINLTHAVNWRGDAYRLQDGSTLKRIALKNLTIIRVICGEW